MLGFLTRLIGGALDPLIDQVSDVGARLLRKLALFLVAGVCLVVVLIALTIALDLWIASLYGSIVGALAVAGLYFCVAALALFLALRKSAPRARPASSAAPGAAERPRPPRDAQIDAFAAPIIAALAKLGLRREQFAVLAGSSLAKQLGPLPLVGLAIVGGFLAGRMWKRWRALLSLDALASLATTAGAIFGAATSPGEAPEETSEDEDPA